MKSNETIVFIGRSGSGKGTQIQLLQDYLTQQYPSHDIFYFGSGEHFRSFVQQDGYTNQIMRDILAQGTLAPDFITEWLLVDAMVKRMKDKDQVLVLDGFPRTINQAHTLDSALDYYKREHIHVLHIDVSEDEVRRRMLDRERGDDQLETIQKRIDWYNENVVPTITHLEQQDNYQVYHINGEQSPEAVHEEIITALGI